MNEIYEKNHHQERKQSKKNFIHSFRKMNWFYLFIPIQIAAAAPASQPHK
jgi:hypothetical protein